MVRYGIAGFGRHAVKRLVPGFLLASNSRLIALSRRDPVRANSAALEHNIPLAFDSTEALCRSPQVDAVFVASPDAAHLDDVLTAVRCGKPVLVEKPMAMNGGEARRMLEAARRSDLKLGVAHIFRFEATVNRARDLVQGGKLGQVVHLRCEFHYPAVGHGRAWINDPTLACGGPIADVGVHCIDTMRYILNDDVVDVSTLAEQDGDSGPFESAAVISLRFSRGSLGTVIVSTRGHYRTPLEIIGSDAVLRADDALNVEHPITLELLRQSKIVQSETLGNQNAYALQVDAFSDWIEGRSSYPCPGEEGLKNQLILDAAYRSWKSGKVECVG